ncbi:hypothetical protein MMYC01_209441, partial [Madurella mycetomatis]
LVKFAKLEQLLMADEKMVRLDIYESDPHVEWPTRPGASPRRIGSSSVAGLSSARSRLSADIGA